MQVSVAREATANTPAFTRVYVSAGTNRFAFMVPTGFRLDASNPERIVLLAEDYSCFITFRIRSAMPADTQELNSEEYRGLILSEHPGAKMLDEFSRAAANHTGPAFDIQWKNNFGIEQTARLAFVPSPAGVLEFGLFSSPEKFSAGQPAFNHFLLGFYTNEGGKLNLPPLSDQI
jgi:hypothetical protein